MANEEIKNRILMEMNEELTDIQLQKLKMCLERNFYGVTIVDNCTDIVTTETVSNEQMIAKFVFEQKISGLSNNTISQYKRETERFFSVINKNFSEVNTDDISCYLAILMGKKISINSVDNSRKFLKPFFKWLYESEYIPKDIFKKIKPIKRVEKPKDFFTDNEIVNMRDVCQNDTRALALVDFLLSTGLRVSECSNLKLENIDFSSGIVNVYATKTGQWRKVYLDSNALKHLRDYLNSRTDTCPYVFVNKRHVKGKITRMQNQSMQKIVQKYCKEANIYRHCHVHLFRKTLATRLYRHGMDVKMIATILGHKNLTTTETYYLSLHNNDIKHLYHKCMS